jgi:ADP-heptose:LPS heptosyltransferase
MDIFLKEEWKKSINGLLKEGQIHIGFQMGASSISRMWFLESWIDLARKVLSYNKSWNIVLTGSKVDQSSASSLCSKIEDNRIIDLTGGLDLGPLAALIGRLDLLVTPDTGPLHIAAAVNTATLGISVAGIAVESNPRSNSTQHVFVQKQKTCKPCIDKKCKYQKCMLQITVDEVFGHICNII